MSQTKQDIHYLLIADGQKVLYDYSSKSGSFKEETQDILGKISPGTFVIPYNQLEFHYILEPDDQLTYMALYDKGYDKMLSFKNLNELKDSFKSTFIPDDILIGKEHQFNNEFQNELLKVYNNLSSSGVVKLVQIQHSLDDLKVGLHQNLLGMNKRDNDLDILCDKTADLAAGSYAIQSKATEVKKEKVNGKWKRNLLIGIGVLVVQFLIYLFMATFCGFSFEQCSRC